MASSNQSDTSPDILAIKEDLKVLRSDVSALVKNASEALGAKSREALESGKTASKAFYKDAKSAASDASDKTLDTVKAHPVAALALAFAAGAACAALVRRS